jgi:hypothetical protein
MLCSKFFVHFVLLFTIPSLVLYPQAEIPTFTPQELKEIEAREEFIKNYPLISYDDILDLIEELEEGHLEERCSPEELDRINNFLIMLARQGVLPGEEALLEQDIQELLSGDPSNPYQPSSYYSDEGYTLIPAISHGEGQALLCKTWVGKKWRQTTKFVSHHKKAIVTGAVVVVAVAVVVVAIVVSGGTAAAAVPALVAGGASVSNSSDKEEKTTSKTTAAPAPATLNDVIHDHILSFKETVVEEKLIQPCGPTSIFEDISFTTRNLGAQFAHESLDILAQTTSEMPNLIQDIHEIGTHYLPDFANQFLDHHPPSGAGFNEKLITTGHQKIDQVFSTDQANRYTPEAKAFRSKMGLEPVSGVTPFPAGLLSGQASGRIAATQASEVKGWTAGQPHNNRTAFGTVPKWSTVRRRYWKNRADWAKTNTHDYTDNQLKRMEQGLAPNRKNERTGLIESKELHHNPSQKNGGLFDVEELWPEEHARVDPDRYIGE